MRGLLNSTAGKVSAVVLAIVGAGSAVWSIGASLSRTDAAAAAQDRIFICAQTGKTFHHRLTLADSIPAISPHSGQRTGYPAELCYWTRSGQIQRQPTAVLLNTYRGRREPTFCPDCGRLVVPHNPPAEPGRKPPPTQSEFKSNLFVETDRR